VGVGPAAFGPGGVREPLAESNAIRYERAPAAEFQQRSAAGEGSCGELLDAIFWRRGTRKTVNRLAIEKSVLGRTAPVAQELQQESRTTERAGIQ
jgi:hypothetical protein